LWQILASITGAILAFTMAVYVVYYIYILINLGKSTKNLVKPDLKAKITLVIPTYNEEFVIEGKLLNLIEQTYPLNLIEIIVFDSNSQDKTVEIVKNFILEHPALDIKIIEEDRRLGKSEAINKAFSSACSQSEIIMMSDADVYLEKDAIKKVISNFGDSLVGAVCGRQILINPEESKETNMEAIYRSFYEKLRMGESIIDSTPLFEGQFAAYRATVIRGEKLREYTNADDCQLAILARRKGFKAVCDEEAIFYEYSPPDRASQQTQKVRRGQGLSRLFWYNKDMLLKKKYGKFGLVILPANFFMHLVSPFLVLLSLIFGLALFFSLVLEGGNLILLVISIAIISSLLLDDFLFRRKFTYVVWTFLEYQMILLKGILLFLLGKSLHRWQKVESVRMKFRNETDVKQVK
jgi:cellulose synthase/poly-beta-1,6-N-acetylglucosamine synthase-like glycosyltransferase